MAGYGEPSWVNSQNNAATTTVSDANVDQGVTVATADGTNGHGSLKGKGGCVLCMLSILNMGLAVLMSFLGVLTIIRVHQYGIEILSEPFLAFYMILFAVLLFLYELMWWAPSTKINDDMRLNFGFMYGLRGKGLYLIFVAFLCLGLGKEAKVAILNYFTGVAFLIGGLLHIFVVCYRPEIAGEYQPSGRVPADDENVV